LFAVRSVLGLGLGLGFGGGGGGGAEPELLNDKYSTTPATTAKVTPTIMDTTAVLDNIFILSFYNWETIETYLRKSITDPTTSDSSPYSQILPGCIRGNYRIG